VTTTTRSRRATAVAFAVLAAVVAALLAAPVPALAQGAPTLTIQPPGDTETDVNFNDRIRISGSGFPDAPIASARLVGLRADGSQVEQAISGLNSPPSPTASYLRNDAGTISGAQRLGSNYANPSEDWCLPATTAQPPAQRVVQTFLEVVVQGAATASNTLRVDYCQPILLRYDVVGPRTVRAVFSEPVHYAQDGLFDDSGLDWDIINPTRFVTDVQVGVNDCASAREHPNRDGCTRILTLSQDLAEDQTPGISYEPGSRPQYVDFANGSLQPVSFERLIALDRIRPRKPGVAAIAGRTPVQDQSVATGRRVIANDATPDVQLTSLTAGHTIEIRRGGSLLSTTQAPGSTMTTTLPALGPDGAYDLTAVAVDSAGNRSDDPALSPSGQDGQNNPVTYVLDIVAPMVLGASQTGSGGRQLLVTLSPDLLAEPVSAGTWTLGGVQPTQVQAGQSANQRLLTFAEAPAAGATLAWSAAEGAARYVDAAGNVLADFSGFPVTVIPPPAAPVIQVPAAGVVTRASSTPISGTQQAQSGQSLAVQLYSDAQGTQPIGDPIPVSGGTWSGSAPLPGDAASQAPADQDVTFWARTINTQVGLQSPVATSNTITVDRQDPQDVVITEPSGGTILDGPDAVGAGVLVVRWTAEDPNPDRFQLVLVDAADRRIECSEEGWVGDGPYEGTCDIPQDVAQGIATLTLVATDAATNATTATLELPVDPDILGATATLTRNGDPTNPGEVTIAYTEPLTGGTSGAEWRTDDGQSGDVGRRPLTAQVTGESDTVVLRFTQPFPGPAHPNARPVYAYDGPLVGEGLRGADGDPIPTSGIVFDITRAALAVDPVPATVRGTTARGQIATCTDPAAVGAPCPASGPVLRLTGRTDSAFDLDRSGTRDPDEFNTVTIVSGDLAQAGSHPRLATAVVAPEGTFEAIVPLNANGSLTFTVVAEDINPFPGKAPTTQVLTVVDDSLGPVISMTAQLVTGAEEPAILVPMQLSEIASTIALEHSIDGGPFQPIQTIDASADRATFRWTDLPFDLEDLATGGLQIRATATDPIGNVGPPTTVGLSNLPELTSAELVEEDVVVVTTTEPVATASDGAAGFSVGGGPGVAGTSAEGDRITLDLADPLGAGTFEIRYGGTGGWMTADERPLVAGSVPLVISDELIFAVTGLAAGPSCTGDGAVLSFVDERDDGRVTGYEVLRDGEVIATLAPDERVVSDPDAGDGVHVYEVIALGADGARSEPVSVRIELGGSPVPAGAAEAALAGGTGAPAGADLQDDVAFGGIPNIGPAGGTVLSCDGRVAALVPPGAAGVPAYGAIVRRSAPPVDGASPVTDLYQLVAVEAGPGFPVLHAVDGFVELSFRDLASRLGDAVRERVAVLRPHASGPIDENGARVGRESVATQLLTVGTFGVVQQDGASVRVYGPDPVLPTDRFATAAGLSQTQLTAAASAVIARADDYPDALAAAPLAAQLGAPVLLSRTTDVPTTTMLELARLGTDTAYLVGGEAALSPDVATQLEGAGIDVVRVAGPTRFETAAEVAGLVGSVDGGAFLATGGTFADALAASAPAAALGRPILLTAPDGSIPEATRIALDDVLAVAVHVVGGEAAVPAATTAALAEQGFVVDRSGGATRYATAVELASALVGRGLLDLVQPVVASGDGDGVTSPDALAAGPIGGRLGSVLLLTPQGTVVPEVAAFLAEADGLRGLLLAGGEAAVTRDTRRALDDAAG
jgi:putative cell wall-binding protein